MSAPKIGDRVRVEFEGEIWKHDFNDERTYLIRLDGMGDATFDQDHPSYPSVYGEHCTVIAPPVKVGDKVTAENAESLSQPGTVLAYRYAIAWYDVVSESWLDGKGRRVGVELLHGATVLRIGGTS